MHAVGVIASTTNVAGRRARRPATGFEAAQDSVPRVNEGDSLGACELVLDLLPSRSLRCLNWRRLRRCRPGDIEAGLAAVSASGVARCVQLRPGCGAAANEVAERCGMVAQPPIPQMATAELRDPYPCELIIRELELAEPGIHCGNAGPAFAVPADLLAKLLTPTVLGLPRSAVTLASCPAEPVVTAVSVTALATVGTFNVATLASYRRCGYGTTVTARAFADGVIAGAAWGWPLSTEAGYGYGVYQRLGFNTIERWTYRITP